MKIKPKGIQMSSLRFDFVTIDDKATITADGFIRDKPILTRSGIFEYRRADGTVQREYRPPDEVFSAAHLATIRGAPVTDGHPGRVHADNAGAVVGAILSEGERQDQNLLAEVVIHSPKRLGTKKELSLGYSVDLDETPGEVDGQKYDAVQRNLRVNHLAVVHRGRAGNAKLRLDRMDAAETSIAIEDDPPMPDPIAVKLVTVRLDSGLEYQASPEVAAALKSATDAAASAKARADAVEAERDSLKAAAAADKAKHDAALVKARADALAETKTRLTLEGVATAHGVEFKADMSDRAIREAVANKLAPNTYKFDEAKSDDYVAAAFDGALARADADKATSASNRATAYGAPRSRVQAPAAPAPRADSAPAGNGPIRSSAELRRRLGMVG